MVKLEKPLGIGLSKPFKFQPGWFFHPDFPGIVHGAWRGGQSLDNAIQSFTNSAEQWNREVFGNFFSHRKKIEARLNGVQMALANRPNNFLVELERSMRKEYVDVKELIDEFWAMKARVNWRKRIRITSLKNSIGNCIIEENEVVDYIRRWYINLYTTDMKDSQRKVGDIPNWPVKLSEEEAQVLALPIEEREIKNGLWALKAFKGPGPDGLHVGFYQRFWIIMRKSVVEVKRLRSFLDSLISPLQATFVPGQKGVDNAIIIQELLHMLSLKKGKVGCMEVLGFFIKDKCDAKLWDPVKMSRGGLAVSHLFFVDDLVLFAKVDMKNCISMLDALEGFYGISGQKISKVKSRVYFSPNVDGNKREELCKVLGIWSTPKLGKVVLAHSVLTTILACVMQSTLLPNRTLEALD
ncbi:uncharacterized protein LOC142635725 [Castanea sativa]|uniref:uncharacterized protein LOC142635725 n=1 Tax=Castanea sativa TaxID=21020 RepID=UPI003F64C4A4